MEISNNNSIKQISSSNREDTFFVPKKKTKLIHSFNSSCDVESINEKYNDESLDDILLIESVARFEATETKTNQNVKKKVKLIYVLHSFLFI